MKTDPINPPHYRIHPSGIEAIEISEKMGFSLGNAFKYLFRCGHKNCPLEDLQKALWYLNRELPNAKDHWLSNWFYCDYSVNLEAPWQVNLVVNTEPRYAGYMAETLGWIWAAHATGRKTALLRAIDGVEKCIRIEKVKIKTT